VLRSVSYSAKARQDLQREWHYLHTNAGAATADRLLAALERTSSLLASNPHIGTLYNPRASRTPSVRRLPLSLPFGRWLLFYESTEMGIFVHRLAHGARDLSGFLQKEASLHIRELAAQIC
jgi:plasmid stabilization system protein ParE